MDFDALADQLLALAHPTRLRVLAVLGARPEGVPAGEISATLKVKPSTMSAHLSALARAGLVRARREGVSVIYLREDTSVAKLLGEIAEAIAG